MGRESVATMTSKSQITVPRAVRRHLGLQVGDKLVFVVEEDGTVLVRTERYPTIASLAGAAGTLADPLPWDQVLEIAHEDYAHDRYGERR